MTVFLYTPCLVSALGRNPDHHHPEQANITTSPPRPTNPAR
jgi:hypothetical protein